MVILVRWTKNRERKKYEYFFCWKKVRRKEKGKFTSRSENLKFPFFQLFLIKI